MKEASEPVSAALYSLADAFNPVGNTNNYELAGGFVVVHNPHAINPLPPGFFPKGQEWYLELRHRVL
jgi:hypothetical protein